MDKVAAEPNKRITFLPRDFFYPSVLMIAVCLGLATGFTIHGSLKPPISTTEGNASNYAPDKEAILAHYEKVKGSTKNYLGELAPHEFVSIAYSLLERHPYVYSRGFGTSLALGGISQDIQSTTIKEGGRYFEESNSIGLVKLYDRMYQEGETTTKYWGSTPSYEKNAPVTMGNDEYKESMGRYVSESLIYVVSEKTEGKEDLSGDGLTQVKTSGDGYLVDFEGVPSLITLNYVRQMKTISSLKEYPSFDFVHLQWKLDANLELQWFKTHEKYQASTMGVTSPCEGRMTTVYVYGDSGTVPIPKPGEAWAEKYPKNSDELLTQYGFSE